MRSNGILFILSWSVDSEKECECLLPTFYKIFAQRHVSVTSPKTDWPWGPEESCTEFRQRQELGVSDDHYQCDVTLYIRTFESRLTSSLLSVSNRGWKLSVVSLLVSWRWTRHKEDGRFFHQKVSKPLPSICQYMQCSMQPVSKNIQKHYSSAIITFISQNICFTK